MGEGPLVVACLRYADLRPAVDPLTGAVTQDPRAAGAAPQEEAALEHALRIADAWNGRVLAVVAGPADADVLLRTAAAVGADVLRVPWTAEYVADLAGDERPLAAALAAAIRSVGSPSVVVCGDRSADRGTGAVPAYLAHELGAAQALGLVALAVDGTTLTAERRLDAGRRERLRHTGGPIVCSVEAAGVRLRRASLPASLAAARLAVPVCSPPPDRSRSVLVGAARAYRPRGRTVPAPVGDTARVRLLALTGALTQHDPPTIVGPVGAAEAADALLAYLARHDYVNEGHVKEGHVHEGAAD